MQGGNYYEQKKSLINLTFWPLVIDPSIIGLESKLCLACKFQPKRLVTFGIFKSS